MPTHALLASLWENADWAVTSQDSAGIGYDSNVYDRRGGAGDGYALVAPGLTLKRVGSLTDLEVSLELQSYTYFDLHGLDSVDPALNIVARYPYNEGVDFPTEQLELGASRTTEVNSLVGGRLRRGDMAAGWEGNVAEGGKTVLQGRVHVHEVDYLTAGFNDNVYSSGGLTLGYIANERLELGVGYDFSYSESRPKLAGGIASEFRQNLFTLRGRGDLLPKVTGSFFVGAADTAYKGPASESNLDLECEFNLSWQPTQRGRLTLKANRQTYFSPDGYAYIPSTLGLEWTQEIAGGYSATLGADVQRIGYPRDGDGDVRLCGLVLVGRNRRDRGDLGFGSRPSIGTALAGPAGRPAVGRRLGIPSPSAFGSEAGGPWTEPLLCSVPWPEGAPDRIPCPGGRLCSSRRGRAGGRGGNRGPVGFAAAPHGRAGV